MPRNDDIDLQLAEERGYDAGRRGESSALNPYKRADRRLAWIRGWRNGEEDRHYYVRKKPGRNTLQWIRKIKQQLET